jgi:hypothetical protein
MTARHHVSIILENITYLIFPLDRFERSAVKLNGVYVRINIMKRGWILALMLVFAVGCTHHEREEHEEADEHEVKMSINDIPAPARETIMREAEGASIATVDKQQWHGQTGYEADAMIDGKNWEIIVNADGKLLTKQIDNEENEQEGK